MASSNLSKSLGYKVDLDDTFKLTCKIESSETHGDHVEYRIRVQRGLDSRNSWTISKRYREFDELYTQLKVYGLDLPFPQKKLFGNMRQEFIEQRQYLLQDFLDKITQHLVLSQAIHTKKFLNEENYSQNFVETAHEHVSMFTRSEPNWSIVESLKEFGTRFRKQYSLVANSSEKFMMSWCDYGPDKALRDVDLTQIFQQFSQFKHDFLVPISLIYNNDFGALCIQRFYEKGSLRDHIHGVTKIKQSFIKKYCIKKSYCTLKLSQIKLYSRQILETLLFLHSKNVPYGHLHSGNIIIESESKVRLTDLHNSSIGLPSAYRSLLVENSKANDLELVDVYCFGLVLYEMVYGESFIDKLRPNFNDCPFVDVKSILDIIFDTNPKKELPRLAKLLEMPLVNDVKYDQNETVVSSFKSSTKLKPLLVKSREQIEKRLQDDQKALYKFNRKAKLESKVFSEDEVRRRRREAQKTNSENMNTLEYPTPSNTQSKTSQLPKQASAPTISCPPPPPPILSNGSVGASSPPPPPPPPPPSLSTPTSSDRSGLLSSIHGFSKNNLKKAVTIDKSKPKL